MEQILSRRQGDPVGPGVDNGLMVDGVGVGRILCLNSAFEATWMRRRIVRAIFERKPATSQPPDMHTAQPSAATKQERGPEHGSLTASRHVV
jgi:hypothetical protein